MEMAEPDLLPVLRAFVEAHAQPHPNTGDREPIDYLMHLGGSTLVHHGLNDPPPKVDKALIEELHLSGLVDIDYREHHMRITPTPEGRRLIAAQDRAESRQPAADVRAVVEALTQQAQSDNKLAWPAVRPVLLALRRYWEEAGFPQHGVQLRPLLEDLPDGLVGSFATTIRTLDEGDYLHSTSGIGVVANGFDFPAEIVFTARAHSVLDGWPGAAPDELFNNLLAVLAEAVSREEDPERRRRLERLAGTVRDVGVATAGEVLAKVLGGAV